MATLPVQVRGSRLVLIGMQPLLAVDATRRCTPNFKVLALRVKPGCRMTCAIIGPPLSAGSFTKGPAETVVLGISVFGFGPWWPPSNLSKPPPICVHPSLERRMVVSNGPCRLLQLDASICAVRGLRLQRCQCNKLENRSLLPVLGCHARQAATCPASARAFSAL